MVTEQQPFECWGIVEVMGHRSFGGRVSEQTIGGTSFVRIDVAATERQPAFTKFFGASSIYCISPTTEELARQYQEGRGSSPPVEEYDLPEATRRVIREGRKVIEARPTPAGVGDSDDEDDLF